MKKLAKFLKVTGVLMVLAILIPSYQPTSETLNNPPATPSSPIPADGATVLDTSITLSWKSLNPDGDELSFDVYLSKDRTKVEEKSEDALLVSNLKESSYEVSSLERGETYYWRVIAKDSKGAITEGPVWRFTVKEEIRYIAIAGGDGIFIVDISNPSRPNIVGMLDTDGLALGVHVQGGYAYVADDNLVIVDVSDPSNPRTAFDKLWFSAAHSVFGF